MRPTRPHFWVLEGHEPRPATPLAWAHQFEWHGRIVAETRTGATHISTVFMGVELLFNNDGPPLLFETLVYGGAYDGQRALYATWEEAQNGHQTMVMITQGLLN